MKKFRWILLCAALLAAALFALWRLPALFAPSVPAALTYTPPDDETVSAVRAAVQDRFGSAGVVYLLPDCEIDAVSLEYRPLSDPNLGGARWVLLRSDSGVSSLFLYSVRWDSFTEITDQSENGFDPSLGKSLTDCATSHGCTPTIPKSHGFPKRIFCKSTGRMLRARFHCPPARRCSCNNAKGSVPSERSLFDSFQPL